MAEPTRFGVVDRSASRSTDVPKLPQRELQPVTASPINTFAGAFQPVASLGDIQNPIRRSAERLNQILRGNAQIKMQEKSDQLADEVRAALKGGATPEDVAAGLAKAGESDLIMRHAWEQLGQNKAHTVFPLWSERLLQPDMVDEGNFDVIAAALGEVADREGFGDPEIPYDLGSAPNEDFARGYNDEIAGRMAAVILDHINGVTDRRTERQSYASMGTAGKYVAEQLIGLYPGEHAGVSVTALDNLQAHRALRYSEGIDLAEVDQEIVLGATQAIRNTLEQQILKGRVTITGRDIRAAQQLIKWAITEEIDGADVGNAAALKSLSVEMNQIINMMAGYQESQSDTSFSKAFKDWALLRSIPEEQRTFKQNEDLRKAHNLLNLNYTKDFDAYRKKFEAGLEVYEAPEQVISDLLLGIETGYITTPSQLIDRAADYGVYAIPVPEMDRLLDNMRLVESKHKVLSMDEWHTFDDDFKSRTRIFSSILFKGDQSMVQLFMSGRNGGTVDAKKARTSSMPEGAGEILGMLANTDARIRKRVLAEIDQSVVVDGGVVLDQAINKIASEEYATFVENVIPYLDKLQVAGRNLTSDRKRDALAVFDHSEPVQRTARIAKQAENRLIQNMAVEEALDMASRGEGGLDVIMDAISMELDDFGDERVYFKSPRTRARGRYFYSRANPAPGPWISPGAAMYNENPLAPMMDRDDFRN